MRDGDGRVGPGWWAVPVLAATLAVAGSAEAQRLHGQVELEYQNLDRATALSPRESWVKTFQSDYSRSLPGAIEFSSRFRFSEQTVVGQSDRLRNPEGNLRLAHRYFGLSASYRPSDTRDSRSLTIRQQTFSLTGNAQVPGLPRVSGSWIRSHLDASSQSAASGTVTRSVSAAYTVPHLDLRAGYGDRLLDAPTGLSSRVTESHVNLGSSSQFRAGRAPVALQYDFSQSRANPTGLRSRLSRSHSAGGTSSLQLSSRTMSNLTYSFRRSETVDVAGASADEHNGALSLSHALADALQMSASAGVRSASFGGRTDTERFAAAAATSQGQLREGWRIAATLGRSLNWLPGASVRVADNFQTNTSMRLARGLEARGDLSLSSGRRPTVASDSLGPRDVSLQTGAGITANPLRTVYLDASASRQRTGASLSRTGPSASSFNSRLRLTPSTRLVLSGSWGLTYGLGSRGTTVQTSVQWSLGPSVQASGSYARARQVVPGQTPSLPGRQESFSGTLVMALGRDLTGSLRYSEANWRYPSHVRQLSASIVRSFGR